MKKIICLVFTLCGFLQSSEAQIQTSAGVEYLQNMTKDMSTDFSDLANTYFLADSISSFDVSSATGKINWKRYRLAPRQAFNLNGFWPVKTKMLDFPDTQYDNDPNLKFQLHFIDDRTVRVTMFTSAIEPKNDDPSNPMLAAVPANGKMWKANDNGKVITYKSEFGSIEICKFPFRITLRDADGKLLTQTRHIIDDDSTQVKLLPFNFIKRGSDNSRSVNPVFLLSPNEKIYGCGESFTSLNKVGQKINLFVTDPQGPETEGMYKPVPFFFSNRGYGVFANTSAPMTCDFGQSYIGAQRLFMGDEKVDLFVFFGQPKDILNEYTNITGKSPMLPLWTFGTWMSRISYFSQKEGLDVAAKLRSNKIPADVIHFDTGWFGVDWQCDYEFAKDRFPNPEGMLKQLKKENFHVCLWQLPYFTPKNRYYKELVDGGMAVRNGNGTLPYEDAVLDFSNPKTVDWYQQKIGNLIKKGVSVIKGDFGEAAPFNGLYASGRTGFYEHNIYPLRYNKALFEGIEKALGKDLSSGDGTNDNVADACIWARSAWAGSQRYPLHWGGDAATNNIGNTGMMGDLRGGLSLGLSGFSFWSHDIGGFVTASPEDLYRRWLSFGFLSSHTRAHGAPPTEPWLISESFTNAFRDCAEMKYKLMPYVYAQAKLCSEQGLPMVRALFVEFPEDAGAWTVEDEYMFGNQILVAPLLESGSSRTCYLPKGKWIDYQNNNVYDGGYQTITVGKIPCVILVRDGSLIPTVPIAQSTADIDWTKLTWTPYKVNSTSCVGYRYVPGEQTVTTIDK